MQNAIKVQEDLPEVGQKMSKAHLSYVNTWFSDSAFSALLRLHFNACLQPKGYVNSHVKTKIHFSFIQLLTQRLHLHL